MKYRFHKIKTVQELLEAIGRKDIPNTKVKITQPVIDEATGEYLADLEIEIPDEYPLSPADERKLESLMAGLGFKLKEKLG